MGRGRRHLFACWYASVFLFVLFPASELYKSKLTILQYCNKPLFVLFIHFSFLFFHFVSSIHFLLFLLQLMQAGLLKPDVVEGSDVEIPEFNVSYKPQKISPKFQSTVRHLLHQKIRDSYMHPQFVSDVMKPLQIEQLMDQEVVNLSGGELQRVALCLCLGKVFYLFIYVFMHTAHHAILLLFIYLFICFYAYRTICYFI